MYLKKKDKHAHISYDIRIKPNQTSEQYFAKNNVHRIDEYTHTHTKEDVAICVLEEEGDILFSSFCLVVLTSRSKCTQPCLGRRENSPSNEHRTKPCIVESVDAGIPGPLRIAAAL